MATYGFDGSTLNDELNRLANGGATYPTYVNYLDQAAAAKKWAIAKGKTLGKVTDLVGVINIIGNITSLELTKLIDVKMTSKIGFDIAATAVPVKENIDPTSTI